MNEELLRYLGIVVAVKCKSEIKKRKWVKNWLSQRASFTHITLLNELSLEPSDWRNYLRMDEATYFQLLYLVSPLIRKQDTNMRKSISPHERLTATLRFLATGMSYEELKFVTIISPQRLGVIIPETCRAIIQCLQGYMKIPESTDECKQIARDFEEQWHFPHCIGAIDGKHIRINPPPGSGSYFWNYKQFHSVVLMACVNANYEFTWCEVGTNGRVSDGGVIKNTNFYEDLVNKKLHIPDAEHVNGTLYELPYVFVGDEAFALRPDFMKPFSQKTLSPERRIFNYRLSRARMTVENTFGIMASRFRIFQRSICLSLERIDLVVLTCCILHNFLRKLSNGYVLRDEISQTQSDPHLVQLHSLQRTTVHNSLTTAKTVREMFTNYFSGEGEVSWQYDRL